MRYFDKFFMRLFTLLLISQENLDFRQRLLTKYASIPVQSNVCLNSYQGFHKTSKQEKCRYPLLFDEQTTSVQEVCIQIKKTRRLAIRALGRRQRHSCTYTVFLKFLTTSNGLPARNLYFFKV